MSTTTTAPPVRRAADTRRRVGQVLLTVLLTTCALVAVGTAFTTDDPLPREGIVLVATFGVLAAVYGLVVVWTAQRSRAARAAVWALPLFFAVHVALLGTWLPDAAFGVAAAVGALLVAGDSRV